MNKLRKLNYKIVSGIKGVLHPMDADMETFKTLCGVRDYWYNKERDDDHNVWHHFSDLQKKNPKVAAKVVDNIYSLRYKANYSASYKHVSPYLHKTPRSKKMGDFDMLDDCGCFLYNVGFSHEKNGIKIRNNVFYDTAILVGQLRHPGTGVDVKEIISVLKHEHHTFDEVRQNIVDLEDYAPAMFKERSLTTTLSAVIGDEFIVGQEM